MLVTPYVFISVQTSLTVGLSTALVRSARSLGAGRLAVFRFVYWPVIRPGLLAGSVLGFAVSFDEVVLALFMQGATTVTLPVRMFTSIEYDLTPKIAASASLFIALAVLGIVVQSLSARDAASHERSCERCCAAAAARPPPQTSTASGSPTAARCSSSATSASCWSRGNS